MCLCCSSREREQERRLCRMRTCASRRRGWGAVDEVGKRRNEKKGRKVGEEGGKESEGVRRKEKVRAKGAMSCHDLSANKQAKRVVRARSLSLRLFLPCHSQCHALFCCCLRSSAPVEEERSSTVVFLGSSLPHKPQLARRLCDAPCNAETDSTVSP